MNNNDKLELVMEEAISKGYKTSKDIKQWNSFDEELKNNILRELKIVNSEEEIDSLSDIYINENDDEEPVTIGRVSRFFNFSFASAEIIKDRIIDKEDDAFFDSKNELDKQWLKNQIHLIEKNPKIEKERKELIKKEGEDVCIHGLAEIIMLAKRISDLLKSSGYYYYNLSSMVASTLQYELGIHDVDCYKFNIDYHAFYGENFDEMYDLNFMVSHKHHRKILDLFEKYFFDYELLRLCIFKDNDETELSIYPNSYLIPIKNYDKNAIIEMNDYQDGKCKSIPYKYWEKNKNKFVKVSIYAAYNSDFFAAMNKIDGLNNIDKYDIGDLNIALIKGIRQIFDGKYHELPISSNGTNLSYDEFLNWLIDILIKSEKANTVQRKAIQIERLTQLIFKAHYFINFPEESYKFYFKDFYQAKIKDHLLVNINDDEDEKNRMSIDIKNYHFDIVDRYIGIFFVIDGKLLTYKEKLEYVDENFIDVKMSHYAFFNTLSVSFDNEYSMFPRGRILYNNKEQCFYLYADKNILKNKGILKNIKKEFNLPNFNIKYKSDEHYKTLNY